MIRALTPAALLLAASLASPCAAQETDWAETARSDIAAAFALFRDNHPGWHDEDNPAFRRQLEAARDAAMLRAENATSQDGYADALRAFDSGLSDGHARVFAVLDESEAGLEMVWPGFVAAWRGQQAIIHSAAPDSGWVAGSVVSACDGRPFAAFARERIIKAGGRPAEDGQWWRRVPTLFYSSTTDIPAQRCTVVQPDGPAVTRDLAWGKPPADLTKRLQAAGEGETLPIGLSRATEGIWWIALPSFAPDAEQKKAYDRLYTDLEARQADLASARAMVIDLRGNQGGSSQWSKQVAARLWGEDAVEARLADFFKLVSIAWRASADNLAHIRALRVQFADQPDLVAWLEGAETGLAAALEAGEPYWIEDDAAADEDAQAPSPATSFATPVYVITGGPCASACLDAVDLFTRFEGVTLMGAPTSADTPYMEARMGTLPSGKGSYVMPVKVWRGRPRPGGFVYHPRLRIDSPEWTQEVLLATVERDLAGR